MPKRYASQCSVVIDDDTKNRLEALAMAGGIAQAEIVRAALIAYLPKLERGRAKADRDGVRWRPRLLTVGEVIGQSG